MTVAAHPRGGAADVDGGAPVFTVRAAESRRELDAVLALRWRVFCAEQGIADTNVSDPDDARSFHALAVVGTPDGERLIGTGRLTLGMTGTGDGQIAWVATEPAYRRQGVGAAVMAFLLAAADGAGAPMVVLNAQTHALAFYRRLGFVTFARPFVVRGIQHQMMGRRHPRLAGRR